MSRLQGGIDLRPLLPNRPSLAGGLLTIMGQKFPWREDLYALAQPGGEMDPVPRDKTFRTPRNGDLKERFIVGIWEGFPQGGRRHRPPPEGDEIQQRFDLVSREPKLRPFQDFAVFGNDSGIKTERQFPGGNHSDDLAACTKRRQKPRHQNVRIEDDVQRRRFSRTTLISASISSWDILSVPCSTDRR